MKKIFKSVILFLVFVFCASGVGCGVQEIGEPINASKTQLYVATYEGGASGESWLDGVASRFEEKYKDTCFEPGTDKKGVQVHVASDKTLYHGSELLNNIGNMIYSVIFTENLDYYAAVSSGLIAEISDTVNENLSEKFGENTSIAEKMFDEELAFMNINGKIYGVPHYLLFGGLIYDVDLFEDNNFYFNSAGTGFVRNKTEMRSAGPDGKPNTPDDGLPATYDDFFLLCKKISDCGFSPMAWSGMYQAVQTNYTLWSLFADYEGKENFMPNFEFSGSVNDVVDSISETNGKIGDINVSVRTENISPETGYHLTQQAGKYYALKFFEKIVRNGYYDKTTKGTMVSHLGAQENFIKGYFEDKPIAMLCDGSWWENEASGLNGAFETAEQEYGQAASKKNRRFAMMPLPKATRDKVGEPFTLGAWGQCYGVINATAVKNDKNLENLSKLFLQFVSTKDEIERFTLQTGSPKSFKYDIDQARIDSELTYYQKSVWDIFKNANVLMPYSSSSLLKNNKSTRGFGYDWFSTINKKSYGNPITAYIDNASVTAEDYFFGLKTGQESWNNKYVRFF